MLIREAAVAGAFYPADQHHLQACIEAYFGEATFHHAANKHHSLPKALILPHAGYIYSGAVAAEGYSLLADYAEDIHTVLLLGPSHRVAFRGIATTSSDYFSTPLGDIKVDREASEELQHLPSVYASDQAHLQEHSLEVHLPFLQSVLSDFSIIPLVVGDATADEVAEVISLYLGKPGVLVVISTDLSHFHDYQQARTIDQQTSDLINEKYFRLSGEQACGCRPLNGLLKLAAELQLSVEQLALCNSGDTSGDKSRVVGYGAYAIY